MLDWAEIKPLLEAKLDKANTKPPSKFGPKGDYIEGWLAIAEANRIFGFGGWSYEIADCRVISERDREIGKERKPGFGVTYTAMVIVRVGDVVRSDVGAGHGYDVDCGLAHESAIKEAVTDALKRALRTFGWPFGLALYDKSREHVESAPPPRPAAIAAPSKLSEQARATGPRPHDKASPVEQAIAWLKASTNAQECVARWRRLLDEKPHVAAIKDVAAAYNETFDKLEPFPGDTPTEVDA